MTVKTQAGQTRPTEAAPTATGSSRAHLGIITIGGVLMLAVFWPLGVATLAMVALFWEPAGRLDAQEAAVDEGHTPDAEEMKQAAGDTCLGFAMGCALLVALLVVLGALAGGGL